MAEEVLSQDLVSRLVDSPKKWSPAQKQFIDEYLFVFQKADGYKESLIWRKYKPAIGDVHAIGCGMQQKKRAEGRSDWTYEGALTTNAGALRGLTNGYGDGFFVVHAPEEGDEHLHIGFSMLPSDEGARARRTELADVLRTFFKGLPLDAHVCA